MSDLENNELVKNLIDEFQASGLEVTSANYGGFKKPHAIKDQRPDVIAWDSDKQLYYLGLVADPEKIDLENMDNKLKILSNLVMDVGSTQNARLPFYLGIPKGNVDDVTKMLDDNNIPRDNVFTIEL
ncbi:MAG: hypothetical protein DWQ18_07890 [Crenarchaeota archaeon]|nr:MAG: hypothetical protein DWQ17_01895 [Thermoproteota archaeon]RDJ33083.1 MAG: hypothetical protein DWQ18_07890 [Thermoproteota archaeon]RDJ36413.1 MAG: hypothetical protein DWQ19_07430 [Thermoproteota archaeon]RDJ39042.1 MAG: hypothetical protein DWQ13_01895 [Thermoproteota archaeon]